MKRVFALLLALALVLSLSATAFADELKTTALTISGVTNHTFDGYKLMTVTTSIGSDGTVKYGYAVNEKYRDVIINTLNLDVYFESSEVALKLAADAKDTEILKAISSLNATADQNATSTSLRNRTTINYFADKVYDRIRAAGLTADENWVNNSAKDLQQGYWLVIDVTDVNNREDEVNSRTLLNTAFQDEMTIQAKTFKTTSDKLVDDENDSIHGIDQNKNAVNTETSEDGLVGWEVADHDIGDVVPYSIQGYLSDDAGQYDYYSFRIEDTMSKGLTLKEDTLLIKINNIEKTLEKVGSADAASALFVYETEKNADGSTILNVYPNFGYKKTDGTEVPASKTNGGDILKTFPEGTKVDSINYAKFDLRYSCELNDDAVIGVEGNPNVSKVYYSNDPNDDSIGHTVQDETIVYTYKLAITKVDEKKNPLAGADFDLYKFIAEQGGSRLDTPADSSWVHGAQANSWGHWEKVDSSKKSTNEVKDAEDNVTQAATEFYFEGLDAGFYKLVETAVPSGYNKADDFIFEIVAEHTTEINAAKSADNLNGVFRIRPIDNNYEVKDGNWSEGLLTYAIVNNAGTLLPSTGGMGTTILYIAGAVMMLGAAVLLVTKRRMSVN